MTDDELSVMVKQVDELWESKQAARIASLESALAQYADRQNWGYYDDSGCFKGAGKYTDACVLGPEVAEAALRKESK